MADPHPFNLWWRLRATKVNDTSVLNALRAEIDHLRAENNQLHGEVSEQEIETSKLAHELGDLRQKLSSATSAPAIQDIKRFSTFVADFGPDSELYIWFRHGYNLKGATGHQLDVIANLCDKWERDPASYRDESLATSFDALRLALRHLSDTMVSNYFQVDPEATSTENAVWYAIPSEWREARYDGAITDLRNAYSSVIEAYVEFYRLAHERGLEQQ